MSYSPPLTPRSFLRSFLPASAVAAAMLLAPVAAAQTAPASSAAVSVPAEAGQASDWLYAGSDIPRDTAWQFGILPNGVRYAVRNNGVPPGQVSIRVRMDVGSMFETDAERGFAHLLEHLTFRGSEHIPDGETKRIWQRFGVTFGSDSNAQTTPTQTVYQLDLPSVTPANLDESMIRHALSDAEIETLVKGWHAVETLVPASPPSPDRVASGLRLLETKGCVSCHVFGGTSALDRSFTPRNALRAMAPDLFT